MNIVPFLEKPAAIVGTTGAGKTYAAKGAVEALLEAGRRVVIIDPTGAWYGLRSGADGGSKGGFPVTIFGGDHADIEITPDAGSEIAAAIAGRDVQAIIDVSDMTGGEKTRFLTAFLQRLYADNRAVLHLVVDEADEICPQNPMPEERRLSGAFDKIVRRGRIKGFRPLMITQRPAVLHKNVLSQIGTLIALKLTSPQDRKAIEDWVKGNADAAEARAVMTSLPTLKRGEGWVWSPADHVLQREHFPAIRTFDSSRSPEVGETTVAPALTAVDVAALRAALTPVSKPAEDHAKKPARDIADEIAAAKERGYRHGREDGFKEGRSVGWREAARNQAARIIEAMAGATMLNGTEDALLAAAERIKAIQIDNAGSSGGRTADSNSANAGSNPAPAARASRKAAFSLAEGMNSAAKKILAVLDTSPPVRRTWTQAATLAGLKARGGHFNAGRKALLDSGTVIESGGLVQVVNPSLGASPPTSDPRALIETWEGVIGGAGAKILRKLFDLGGRATKARIAGDLGVKPHGGHWNSGVKALRDNDVVIQDGDVLTLTELFYPKEQ